MLYIMSIFSLEVFIVFVFLLIVSFFDVVIFFSLKLDVLDV